MGVLVGIGTGLIFQKGTMLNQWALTTDSEDGQIFALYTNSEDGTPELMLINNEDK